MPEIFWVLLPIWPLLLLTFVATHWVMGCRRREFPDPQSAEACQAGRSVGGLCFLMTALFSLTLGAVCVLQIVQSRSDLVEKLYMLPLCTLGAIAVSVFTAWLTAKKPA